jgi:hypothetical protein
VHSPEVSLFSTVLEKFLCEEMRAASALADLCGR